MKTQFDNLQISVMLVHYLYNGKKAIKTIFVDILEYQLLSRSPRGRIV